MVEIIVQWLLFAGLAGSSAYYVFVLYAVVRFRRHQRIDPAPSAWPAVTILKPLKGDEPGLYENLATLCTQRYAGSIQVVCGVADARDPAVATVRKLQADFPEHGIDLVIDPRVYGTNHKVSNLYNMMKQARHDILVLADSDIRVAADHLATVVPPLLNPRVGLVTCLYRAVPADGAPSVVESLCINTDFCAMVLVARIVEKARYAFGATIALRREVLDAIGGFRAIANYLADDYEIGSRVAALGYELVLSEQLVDTTITVSTWRSLFQHQLRWARTYRICRPGGYFGSVITHGPLFALLTFTYHGLDSAWSIAALGTIALRLFGTAFLYRHLFRTALPLNHLFLVPVKDLFVTLIWLLAFTGNTVWWSGQRFRVLANGIMIRLGEDAPTTVPWPAEEPLSEKPTLPSS